jgi:hypothetical protein
MRELYSQRPFAINNPGQEWLEIGLRQPWQGRRLRASAPVDPVEEVLVRARGADVGELLGLHRIDHEIVATRMANTQVWCGWSQSRWRWRGSLSCRSRLCRLFDAKPASDRLIVRSCLPRSSRNFMSRSLCRANSISRLKSSISARTNSRPSGARKMMLSALACSSNCLMLRA